MAKRKKTIIVGLKSEAQSSELLLRVLLLVAAPGDLVLAIHVQGSHVRLFDMNKFHIHEDLCESKQVDFQVKVCMGDSHISQLAHQVRINFASQLVIGLGSSRPCSTVATECLKKLPPTCFLVVVDSIGRILINKPGTSQQGSIFSSLESALAPSSPSSQQESMVWAHESSISSPTMSSSSNIAERAKYHFQKSLSMNPSTNGDSGHHPGFPREEFLHRLSIVQAKGSCRTFTSEELIFATNNLSPEMVLGHGGDGTVYKGMLRDHGEAVAVKVFKTCKSQVESLVKEVEILSELRHENIIQLIGYCFAKDMFAIVYNLQEENLRQRIAQLSWSQRMQVAVSVARALEYLHHFSVPPIIHRDVKSSNILVSKDSKVQLSDFGAAVVNHHLEKPFQNTKARDIVGTFGYLAPEYMMYGRVNEKTDVFSYGVVLLELITGKQAIHENLSSDSESLVVWALSLLRSGSFEQLIDPCLDGRYDEEEMKVMVSVAQLCLLHSSSQRPTMVQIVRYFKKPEEGLPLQQEVDELFHKIQCFKAY